jgi:arabinan endo-1,5-alpha-L-arabinosidase
MVGRSENVTGPYVDRDGVDMMNDGGTQVIFPTERWRGPGASAVLQENGVDYLVYHAYDAESQGVFTLRIAPLEWDEEGWPSVSEDEA